MSGLRLVGLLKRVVSGFYFPLTALGKVRNQTLDEVPVLLYHGFYQGVPQSAFMKIDLFDKHLAYLSSRYQLVTLRDLLENHRSAAGPRAVITLDDGFQNNFELAFPVLRKYGATATIFLVTNVLGKLWSDGVSKVLARDQIQAMHEYGIEFGSHSANHFNSNKLSRSQFRDEVVRSKAEIDEIIGDEVVSFSFPYGLYHASEHFPVLQEAGYKCAVATFLRPYNPRRFSRCEIPRLTVYNYENVFDLMLKCRGGQNWLRLVHRLHKLTKTGAFIHER